MKLIQKTNRNFIWVMLGIFPIASLGLLFTLNYFIHDEIDEKLRVDEFRIMEQLKINPDFVSIAPVIEVALVPDQEEVEANIQNVSAFDPIESEDEPFRELRSVHTINGNSYAITIRHSIIETTDLVFAIGLAVLFAVLGILLILFWLNGRLSKLVWRPFNNNLTALSRYSFESKADLLLEKSDIDEFEELNSSLMQLTAQLRADYLALKEFTENASHEIQTPLAIILMHLEEAMQQDLSDENQKRLYAAYQSAKRLSKLNEKLLLLAKLENDQFTTKVSIVVNDLVAEKLEELAPLLQSQEIHIETNFTEKMVLEMDPILANILIVNLLSNAIKHNIQNGKIEIHITEKQVQILNSSQARIESQNLFRRFSKGNTVKESVGLGLSIVKKILEKYDLRAAVEQKEGSFEILISKNS